MSKAIGKVPKTLPLDMHNALGGWMHTSLHGKEGHKFNAGYWYRQAGSTYPEVTLDEERREIVEFILLGEGWEISVFYCAFTGLVKSSQNYHIILIFI